MLTFHLPGMDPSLQRVQGLRIATHIVEVKVGLSRYREAKALVRKADKEKGQPDLLGSKLTYLLGLFWVASHKDLPPVWKELPMALKRQHLTTLQRALNDTARRLSVCEPIILMSRLIKLTLTLGFCLDYLYDLGTGLNHFGLSQHTYDAR